MAERIRAGLTAQEGRKFGLTVGIAFLLLGALFWWRGASVAPAVLGAIGVALTAAGLVVPTRLGPVFSAWMKLALLISKVTTPIFMGIVFFVVITPTGLLMRLFGRRPLRHEETNGSFWVVKPEGERRSKSLERQF